MIWDENIHTNTRWNLFSLCFPFFIRWGFFLWFCWFSTSFFFQLYWWSFLFKSRIRSHWAKCKRTLKWNKSGERKTKGNGKSIVFLWRWSPNYFIHSFLFVHEKVSLFLDSKWRTPFFFYSCLFWESHTWLYLIATQMNKALIFNSLKSWYLKTINSEFWTLRAQKISEKTFN